MLVEFIAMSTVEHENRLWLRMLTNDSYSIQRICNNTVYVLITVLPWRRTSCRCDDHRLLFVLPRIQELGDHGMRN